MAYQTRGRDPLIDSTMQAAIEKRGRELVGIGLMALGIMAAAMVVSYSPDDPSWLLASDAPVENWLGRFGASLAHPLYMIGGRAIWLIPMILLAWGVRLLAHRGADRAVSRLIFAPIAIALASVHAATLTTPVDWTYNFGLGGLFGDTVVGVVLTALPIGAGIGVKLFSLVTGIAMLAIVAFALGFTKVEIARGWRLFLIGLVMAYDLLLRALGRGAVGSLHLARGVQSTVAARREAALATRGRPIADDPRDAHAGRRTPPVTSDAPVHRMPPAPLAAPPRAVQAEPQGFLSRMPSLLKRAEPARLPEAELIEVEAWAGEEAPVDGERIKARITDIVRSRRDAAEPRIEPQMTRPKGPRPLILPKTPRAATPEVATEAEMPEETPLIGEDDEDTPPWQGQSAAIATDPAPRVTPALPRRAVVEQPARKPAPQSTRARAEAQPPLALEDKFADYEFPPLDLLTSPDEITRHHLSNEALEENARMLESVLDDYGVKGEIVSVRPGPVVTMYELEPAPGLKASRVIGLADDIARSMSALSARVSTVPGRSVIGIELPNDEREMVVLREMIAARDFGDSQMKLPLALGKDIGGEPIVANLAKMPHLLIAGTTGSGKSVAINTMILSLLYKLTPEECRLIMIDPKMLELSVYDGIPHLLSPVVTDPKKAVVALKWTVGEMEGRYRKMSKMGVRNIDGYNARVKDALAKGELFSRTVQTGFDEETGDPIFETEESVPELLPYIVVVVDEMADLMMVAGKEIEACIQRLAQMARASGIHLIMATQRPSVDVITGTIKANFPTRISFQVTSKIDSRTILGEMGAEQLLGMGDMLYMAGGSKITRIHGPFCSDEEVEEIVNHLKGFGPPEYMSGVVDGPDDDKGSDIDLVLGLGDGSEGENALYDMAVQIAAKDRKCSTSYIQRKLAIGYNKAARLVEQMEDEGVVSAANHVGKREVLVPEPH